MSEFSFDRKLLQKVSTSDTFWNPGYGDVEIDKYGVTNVPLKLATPELLAKYGTIVHDYEQEKVTVRQWPQEGKRPVMEGTGIQATVNTGEFKYGWNKDVLLAFNGAAVHDWLMITGRLPRNVSAENRTAVLVREANYHPDSSQVFYPIDNHPFVVVLAPPGDDVKPEDFEAFYCDGTFGLHIRPFVWHQPLYPISETASFISKQSSVYACVNFDSVGEFGKFMSIPLTPC